MRAFLICPVRGHDMQETEQVVESLERAGYEVYWPHRDTDQTDTVGLDICKANRAAILKADVVFVVWDGESKGCLFDLGMAFAFGKSVRVIEVPPIVTGQKSFQAMMDAWEDESA